MNFTTHLQSVLSQTQVEVNQLWPEIAPYIPVVSDVSVITEPIKSKSLDKDAVRISQEERSQLLVHLRSIAALPAGQFDEASASGLAHAITYTIGTEVRFTVDDDQLAFSHGVVRSLTAAEATNRLWTVDPAQRGTRVPSNQALDWSVCVSPRELLPTVRQQWQPPWFLYQPILVINLRSMQAVSGQISGILTDRLNRYQFGASSKIIQATSLWSPGAQGRMLVCFLSSTITPGTRFNLQTPLAIKS